MSFPPIARNTRVLAFATAVLSTVCAQGVAAIEPTANVIEYYNASLNHFSSPPPRAKLQCSIKGSTVGPEPA